MFKILIIDDEDEIADLLKSALAMNGYEALIANNARRGIITAQRERPDLILLDIMMPDMDGAEVAKIIKADPKTKNIPILFLTALVSELEDARKNPIMIDDVCYPTLPKTLDIKELIKIIDQNLTG